jgi:hypothetical protein
MKPAQTFSNIQVDDRTPQHTSLYAIYVHIYGYLHDAVSDSV